MLTSVVGINRGDEGKGRMVDLLAEKSDIVCLITFVLNIWTNLTIEGVYKAEPYDIDEPVKWLRLYGDILKSFVCDICEYLYDANDAGKSIMFEAQLGALRYIEYIEKLTECRVKYVSVGAERDQYVVMY